mmetsp:Transcript_12099/g.35067  ORF Transcript_12099/g.35067 Transcript_12099/m.35067 type:complete len:222 (+) Transcript_12099:372-1037(+)
MMRHLESGRGCHRRNRALVGSRRAAPAVLHRLRIVVPVSISVVVGVGGGDGAVVAVHGRQRCEDLLQVLRRRRDWSDGSRRRWCSDWRRQARIRPLWLLLLLLLVMMMITIFVIIVVFIFVIIMRCRRRHGSHGSVGRWIPGQIERKPFEVSVQHPGQHAHARVVVKRHPCVGSEDKDPNRVLIWDFRYGQVPHAGMASRGAVVVFEGYYLIVDGFHEAPI